MRLIVTACCALLFGAADIIRVINANSPDPALSALRYTGIGIALVTVALLIGVVHGFNPVFSLRPPLPQWLLFGLSVIASLLVNGEFESAVASTWMIAGAPLVYFAILPTVLGTSAVASIAWGLVIGDAVFLALSLVRFPLRFPYSGITSNPNSIGVLSATIAAALLTLLLRPGPRRLPSVALSAALAGTFVVVMYSGSRTSMVAFLVSMCLWIVIVTKNGEIRHGLLVLGTCGLMLVAAGVAFQAEASGLIESMLSKSTNNKQSLLADREAIWVGSLAEPKLFGHGGNYFTDTFGAVSHNSLIEVYGRYGVLPAALFVYFGITGMWVAWRHFRQNPASMSGGPFLIIVCFWVISSGETMFGMFAGSINIAFLMCTGLTQAGTACPLVSGDRTLLEEQIAEAV